jgi:hypothetical protein
MQVHVSLEECEARKSATNEEHGGPGDLARKHST